MRHQEEENIDDSRFRNMMHEPLTALRRYLGYDRIAPVNFYSKPTEMRDSRKVLKHVGKYFPVRVRKRALEQRTLTDLAEKAVAKAKKIVIGIPTRMQLTEMLVLGYEEHQVARSRICLVVFVAVFDVCEGLTCLNKSRRLPAGPKAVTYITIENGWSCKAIFLETMFLRGAGEMDVCFWCLCSQTKNDAYFVCLATCVFHRINDSIWKRTMMNQFS